VPVQPGLACNAACGRRGEVLRIAFEIDHYVPSAGGGSDEYENLYYACDRCNQSKTGWTSDEKAIEGLYIIRIDRENPADHLSGDPNNIGKVIASTSTGEYNIWRLDLNRRALQRLREQRARIEGADQVIQHGLRILSQLRIDQFPRTVRWDIEKRRRKLAKAANDLREAVLAHIEEASRADLLDIDLEKLDRDRMRDRYFRQLPPAIVTFARRPK
jgi:hypothetical protein